MFLHVSLNEARKIYRIPLDSLHLREFRLTFLILSGVFWDPRRSKSEFYENGEFSGIIGLAKDRAGVPKDPKM